MMAQETTKNSHLRHQRGQKGMFSPRNVGSFEITVAEKQPCRAAKQIPGMLEMLWTDALHSFAEDRNYGIT